MMVSLLPSFFTEFFFLITISVRPHRSSFVFFSNNFFRFFFPLETKCRLSLSLSLFVFFCLNVRLWFVFVTGLPVCVCVLVCVLRGFCTGVGQRRSSRWVPPLSLSLSLSLFRSFFCSSFFFHSHSSSPPSPRLRRPISSLWDEPVGQRCTAVGFYRVVFFFGPRRGISSHF